MTQSSIYGVNVVPPAGKTLSILVVDENGNHISPGGNVESDTPFYTVGVYRNSDGSPIPNAHIYVLQTDSIGNVSTTSPCQWATTDSQGKYCIGWIVSVTEPTTVYFKAWDEDQYNELITKPATCTEYTGSCPAWSE